MIEYDFLTTRELNVVLDYLSKLDHVKLIAGGTDLLVDIRKESKRLPQIDYILDISNILELKFIKKQGDYLEIGPLVTHNELVNEPLIKENFPVLIAAAKTIGSTQIRNRGTIGGNINNASPAADLLPPLMASKAEVVLTSRKGERVLPLERFIIGPYKTDLKYNELLTKIRIPFLDKNYYSNFQKIGRRKALNIARLNLTLVVKIEKGIFKDTRLVPGAATPYPQLFPKTEEAINDKLIKEIDLEEVGRIASEEMVSITGKRWSTPYKKPVISTLVKRALVKMMKEAKEVRDDE